MPFSKEDKILIKNVYECKDYNAWQFIIEVLGKGWMKNSRHVNRQYALFKKISPR